MPTRGHEIRLCQLNLPVMAHDRSITRVCTRLGDHARLLACTAYDAIEDGSSTVA